VDLREQLLRKRRQQQSKTQLTEEVHKDDSDDAGNGDPLERATLTSEDEEEAANEVAPALRGGRLVRRSSVGDGKMGASPSKKARRRGDEVAGHSGRVPRLVIRRSADERTPTSSHKR
jgi:hypothetical protein